MWQGVRTALGNAVRGFARDRGLGREIVYKRVLGVEYDPVAQTSTSTYSETQLRAIVGRITNNVGKDGRAALGKALRTFGIPCQDLSGEPRPGDLIELGTETYRVIKAETDSAGIRFKIEALRQ